MADLSGDAIPPCSAVKRASARAVRPDVLRIRPNAQATARRNAAANLRQGFWCWDVAGSKPFLDVIYSGGFGYDSTYSTFTWDVLT